MDIPPLDPLVMRRAMDTAINAKAISGIDGRLSYVNRAFLQLWRLSSVAEALGRSVYDFWSTSADVAAVVEALEGRGSFVGELEGLRGPDGERFDVQVSASLVEDEEGRPIAMLASFLEVTETKRIREELLAANRRLEGLWSVTSLQDADAKAISDHILQSLATMTGSEFGFYGFVDPEETEMTIHSWSGRAMEACAMVDKPSCFSVESSGVWAEAIRRREPLVLNDYASPHAAKHGLPAGHVPLSRLLVVPHFSGGRISSVAAVANRAKAYGPADIAQIESFLSSVQAVVDAKLAETALKDSEEQYRNLFENALVGIARVEPDGRYRSINQAFTWMFGYRHPGEILDPKVNAKDFYADPEERRRLVADLAREGIVDRREIRFVRRDGTPFWGLISSRAVGRRPRTGDAEPGFDFLDSYCIDITAQKEAERSLEAALETNKVLLRELYHRTKNNMNVIASMIELQSLRLEDDAAKAALADVQNRIGSMALVHQMLYRSADLSRVDFAAYARELSSRIARGFGPLGARVRLVLEVEPISMLIDLVTPCGLILNELLTNSFKHAFLEHPEPAIRISARRLPEGGAIELSYADNGRGLGGVDPATSPSLGLVSLRALAEHQLQGRIRFGEEGGFRCSVIFSETTYEERV